MAMTRSALPSFHIASIAATTWLLALVPIAWGQEAPYKGPGGQLEAMGAIAAVFAVNVATLDACARVPVCLRTKHRLSDWGMHICHAIRNSMFR